MKNKPWHSKDPSELPLVAFPGRLGWTFNSIGYPLNEIPNRLPVVVTKGFDGDSHIEVEDEAGNTYRLLWWQVEFPLTYRFPDSRREFTEWHPRVRELFKERLTADRLPDPNPGVEASYQSALRWHLERTEKPHPLAGRRAKGKS